MIFFDRRDVMFKCVYGCLAIVCVFFASSPIAAAAVGIVEVPLFFRASDSDESSSVAAMRTKTHPISLYAKPQSGSALVATVSEESGIESEEFKYEVRGAYVYEVANNWVRVRVTGKKPAVFGWIQPGDHGEIHMMADLLAGRLAYLETTWNGELFAGGDTTTSIRKWPLTGEDIAITIVKTEMRNGLLWLEIELYDMSPCEGQGVTVVAKGWVPFLGKNGQRNVWFYARGC